MSNDHQEPAQDAKQQDNGAQDAPKRDPNDWSIDTLPPGAQEYIRELRGEAASNRKARQEAEQRALEEQGKWKELAETRAQQLAELEPYKAQAEAYDKMIRDGNARRIERVPETERGLIPTDYSPEKLAAWLDNNWDRLTRKPAPALDAGARGGTGDAINVTDADRRQAETLKAAGYDTTPEAIAARRLQMLKDAGETQ